MYDLDRFLTAQRRDYAAALREIQNGRKRSHWIWYIFPQVAGLGMSSTSQYYAISGLDEARPICASRRCARTCWRSAAPCWHSTRATPRPCSAFRTT